MAKSRFMARTRKTTSELLLPGASVWQSWTGADGELCQQTGEFTTDGSRFGKEATRRVLALPSTHFWVLPAWLKGETEHLRSMALLHLERMGVKTNEDEASVQVRSISGKEGANLARIRAPKDQPVPLSDTTYLPDEVTHHALCYPMVQNSITLFRELGRLVVAITAGSQLIYCAPLSSTRLDDHALAELNNICLQLGFQGVLGRLESIVLWIDEGDLGKIYRPKYFHGGIAIHGMTSVPNYPASHGCVRLSTQAMDFIWDNDLIPMRSVVWVHGNIPLAPL